MSTNLPQNPRTAFKTTMIARAVQQGNTAPTPDPKMTKFFNEYAELAERLFPELRFRQTEIRSAGSWWAEMHPSLPKGCTLTHKIPAGWVDLQFTGLANQVDELKKLNPVVPHGAEFVAAKKSAMLRIRVPVMSFGDPFEAQRESAIAALSAAAKLLVVAPHLRTK